jgi:hypothetical protein
MKRIREDEYCRAIEYETLKPVKVILRKGVGGRE